MNLEDLNKKRMEEQKNNIQEQLNEQVKMQQQIESLERMAKEFLTSAAIERYGNLKAAHPEKALQVVAVIAQLVQQNQIKEKINDGQFKELLRQITPEKKETSIRRI